MDSESLRKAVENDAEKLWIEYNLIPYIFESATVKAKKFSTRVNITERFKAQDFTVTDFEVNTSVKGYRVKMTAKAMYKTNQMIEVVLKSSCVVCSRIYDETTITLNNID